MKSLRFSFILLFYLGTSPAQSPHNTDLYGLFFDHTDAAGFALGNTGLLPSHNSRFSIANPTTWSELKFALLSVHYNTGEIRYEEENYLAGFGILSNAVFIVPIKNKYSFGLGIKPLTRRKFHIESNKDQSIVFDNDSLLLTKSIEGTGGISSFYSAFSWRFSPENTLALQLDFLFGTFNEFTSSRLFEDNPETVPPVVYQRRFEFNIKLLSLYFSSRSLFDQHNLMMYALFQLPVGSKFLKETDRPPFMDLNLDNIHSGSELPYLENVEEKTLTHRNFPFPVTVSGGMTYKMGGKTIIGFEFLSRIFSKESGEFLNSVSTNLYNGNRISMSLLREAKQGSRQLTQRLHYRIGIFRHQHYISSRQKPLIQNGIGFGIGIPFGLFQNQIDIGFRFSKKDGFLTGDPEFVREVTIGLSLGDIWLVKGKRR